jgi:exonuclease SbcD
MKILHTSDWHLGHQLYGYDREDEFKDFLSQLRAIITKHRPDVLVVAGDIFHVPQPSMAAQKLMSGAFVEIAKDNPDMHTVIIAGNHDSAARHEINNELWDVVNVHVVGQLNRGDDAYAKHVIEIKDKGYVVAVPYWSRANDALELTRRLVQQVGEVNVAGLPVVVTTHATVSGCDYKGHEDGQELCVGGVDAVPLDDWGTGFDYLALGHIHLPQDLRMTSGAARYSGSPLPVSFDEYYPHSVTLVDIEGHGKQPVVEQRGIRPLRRVTSLGDFKSWQEVLEMFKELDPANTDYIRLNIQYDSSVPMDLDARARQIAEGKACRYCLTNMRRAESRRQDGMRSMTINEIREMSPIALIEDYFKSCDTELTDNLKSLLGEVLKAVDEDKRNR